ncbi:hypothetical protein GGS23DRAFT_294223 [Durotheca rogersii]|uniref:uncharacterized protein n=1 Tax=Durotheca rogersii TaxID=419775 RepID=UPI00222071DA|nr:uncharacterized protein GGS23DRAFT_294223 [Durotheca rogersii]KAI5866896.1 hypothetical protein GGS23DRAFT_294223 [Durotheca rogersii]
MEPVPETERMEEFRSSPLPRLRLQQPPAIGTSDLDFDRKPSALRRSTEPPMPSSPSWTTAPSLPPLPYRPRTTSPLSGAHTRSKSVASLAPPNIGRTRSMPGVDGSGRIIYAPLLRPVSPASPSGSPSRNRVPRKLTDDAYPPTSPVRSSVLDGPGELGSPPSPVIGAFNNQTHRRTSSPFRITGYPTSSAASSVPGTPPATATSPSYRFEGISASSTFPSYYLPSSIPSTPTSMRSRSPSISSLETIPDSPDAEEEALEAERIAQLKAAADAVDGADSGESKGRSGLDAPIRGRTLGIVSRDKRKRWSVCGAERRGDLDLETIWED